MPRPEDIVEPNEGDLRLDDFLDDGTHLLADAWEKEFGDQLTPGEKEELNGVLAQFFSGKRDYENEANT
jgi:hypothetical protein